MIMFLAWMGLLAFAALAVGTAAIIKLVNNDTERERETAIREEANRDRSNDWKRHRVKK